MWSQVSLYLVKYSEYLTRCLGLPFGLWFRSINIEFYKFLQVIFYSHYSWTDFRYVEQRSKLLLFHSEILNTITILRLFAIMKCWMNDEDCQLRIRVSSHCPRNDTQLQRILLHCPLVVYATRYDYWHFHANNNGKTNFAITEIWAIFLSKS